MKKVIVLLALMMTAMTFQNCAPSMNASSVGENAQELFEKRTVDELSLPYVGDLEVLALLNVSSLKIRFEGAADFKYSVDLASGSAVSYRANNPAATNKAILSAKTKKMFVTSLTNAKICEQNPKAISPDLACTSVYGMPYAQIMTKGTAINLGETPSGCTWVQDICGAQRAQFKNAISAFLNDNNTISYPLGSGGATVNGDLSVSSN